MIRPPAGAAFWTLLCLVFLDSSVSPGQELQFSRWSGKLNVPDPVAIAFDDQGHAYVTQTQRRKIQDLDIRQHRDWIPNDVGLETVEHKRQFLKQTLAIGYDDANRTHVDDHNKDGHFDYRDLMVVSERIHRLHDSNADGTADTINLFAEDFATEVTGIAAGVLAFDGNVYATIAPDVWKLTDANHDGVAEKRSVLATGFGLHIAYAGHDMHGLTTGPDGRIYWSIGDKGISVTDANGVRYHYPNQGGVLRCNPDGTGFEVFAHGLRNVQELAFDEYGNLFGVDNDADKPGEKERFVYIVRNMDAGWRCNYQYRGKDYDPWMAETLWQPWNNDQPSYIVPPIQNYKDGPAGFTYNPGLALNENWQKTFFLTSAPKGEQWAFQVKQHGASFQMTNSRQIGNGIPLVGINFGPDGGLFGVDWGGGYPLNQSGAVWKIDVEHPDQALRARVRALLEMNYQAATAERLTELLSFADQRIRLKAQFELVRRNDVASLRKQLASGTLVAGCHAIWGMGQLARSGRHAETIAQQLQQTLGSENEELICQALKTLADLPESGFFNDSDLQAKSATLLQHANRRVRFFAAAALHAYGNSTAQTALLAYAETLQPNDTYERFALAEAMQTCFSSQELAALARPENNRVLKLAAVVALRRLASEQVRQFLADASDDIATEAALAIHDDFSITSALPFLAECLSESKTRPEAFVRRSINANFRLGNSECAERVAEFASNDEAPVSLRLIALNTLRDWKTPPPLDKVTGRYRHFDVDQRTFPARKLAVLISDVAVDSNDDLRAAAIFAAARLNISLQPDALAKTVLNGGSDVNLRLAALEALRQQDDPILTEVTQRLLSDSSAEARIAGLKVLAERQPEALPEKLESILNQSESTPERQAAIRLITSAPQDKQKRLLLLLSSMIQSRQSQELWLEVSELAAGRQLASPERTRLTQAFDDLRQDSNIVTSAEIRDFVECGLGGDADRGKQLFETHLEAQCIRCHRTGPKGSNVGPALTEIGSKRKGAELLKSIVAPSADIEKKYQTQVVVLVTGKTVQGVVRKETESVLTLADNQGKTIEIDRDDIDDVFQQDISIMPEMKKALTKREIRDIVAYLQTLKKD